MNKDNSSSANNLEEGVNIESNPGDSEKRNKKFQEGGISDSDSKLKEIDTELERKDQERKNFATAANSKNDIRRIIKLEPDNENPEENNNKEVVDEIIFEEEKSEDDISESDEKQDSFTGTEVHDKKELDSQIKENSNLIRKLEEKVASISEDMNDLIGLYEIVSGQMNPFVGLSKVTKKRLDVLENFDKEMDYLKTRLDNIESLVGKIDISKTSSENLSSIENIDKIIDRALELVLDNSKIDDIINKALEHLKLDTISHNTMGGE